MTKCGFKLDRNQLAAIPRIVDGVQLKGVWFFSKGEQPIELKNFCVNSKSAIWFRGQPLAPEGGSEVEGWCARMMKFHPRGLGEQACLEVLQNIAPTESRKNLVTYWNYWRNAKFVVPAGNDGNWIPNPDFLCRRASQSLRLGAEIQAEQNSISEKEGQNINAGRHRILKKETSRQAQETGPIVEKLLELHLSGEIEEYYQIDTSGLAFQQAALCTRLALELGLSEKNVRAVLGDLRPGELMNAAQEKQWTKPRWEMDEIPELLKTLYKERPFFVFMSQSFVVDEINRMNPGRHMPITGIKDFMRVAGGATGDAAAAVKSLVDEGEIGYLYQGARSDFICPVQTQNLLALQGIFANTAEMGLVFNQFSAEIIRQKPKISARKFSLEAVKTQLKGLIEHFNLQRGSQLPSWNEFISYYEEKILGGIKPYYGRKAAELYVILRNWLNDDPVELQKFLASTKAQKRKVSSTTAEPSIQEASSAPKKSRGVSKTSSRSMPAMPRANDAWGPIALPADMSTTFDGFLAQYLQLPRTPSTVRDTSAAATTSGGVPLAASLRAGFRDTVTAQFVDMRSHLPAAGLYARESPSNGDCLFTAFLTDDQLSKSQVHALRRQVAVALHGTPDTPVQSARNSRGVANYLFQRDEHNGPQQSLGIDEVPNRVRAGLEVLDGMYSDADLTIPLFCRLLDERAAPGTPPANVMLLSEMDGHVVIFTASDRTAISVRHLSPVELQQTLHDLHAASAAMVILREAHFDRIQPM